MVDIVDVVATSHFDDPRIGSVSRKQRLRIPKPLAEYLHGLEVVRYLDETPAEQKKSDSTDPPEDGGEKQSASSPADPVSDKKTAAKSKKQDGEQS